MQISLLHIIDKSMSAAYILFAMYLCPFLLSGYLPMDVVYMCALYVCPCGEPMRTGSVCLCALINNPTACMHLYVCMRVHGCTRASV